MRTIDFSIKPGKVRLMQWDQRRIVLSVHGRRSSQRRPLPRVVPAHAPQVTQDPVDHRLFFSAGGRRYGLEFRFNSAPQFTRSMLIAINDLQLEHLWIVCPLTEGYQVQDRVTVMGLGGLQTIAE